MIEVMTSLCARLYGRRSAKNRAARALAAAQEGGPDLPDGEVPIG
jgi:putative resolvase